jgi:hypothetical protein
MGLRDRNLNLSAYISVLHVAAREDRGRNGAGERAEEEVRTSAPERDLARTKPPFAFAPRANRARRLPRTRQPRPRRGWSDRWFRRRKAVGGTEAAARGGGSLSPALMRFAPAPLSRYQVYRLMRWPLSPQPAEL